MTADEVATKEKALEKMHKIEGWFMKRMEDGGIRPQREA